MALSKDQVQAIVARRASGEKSKALAGEFGVSEATIKYHVDRAAQAATPAVIGPPATVLSGPEFPSDADLGIGEEIDEPVRDPLTDIFNDPRFAAQLDALVMARVAQMGIAPSAGPARSEEFSAFTETLKHLINVNASQQPGYQKPLPADEVDRRAAGYVEMTALLKTYEKEDNAPLYLLGDFFFECTNAISFEPGQQIRTYLAPSESFIPKNEPAEKVYAAMMQWIGGETPHIGDQVEAAMREAHKAPLVTGALNTVRPKGVVELVDAPKQDMNKKRVLGTIQPERHGNGQSVNQQPVGPSFGADAVAA